MSNQFPNAPLRTLSLGSRYIPISLLNITATSSGTAQTLITAPAGEAMGICGLNVTNSTGSAAELSIHAVPSGVSIGATNLVLSQRSIPANATEDLTDLLGGVAAFSEGTAIQVFAGTSASLNIWGTAKAWT